MEPIIGKRPLAPQGAPGPQGAAPGAADLIKDANVRTFAADVLDASMERPVLVDFWAPWCGPCKQLTPILEKVVRDARGAVRLVKVNIDENQDIARQLRIQSIPAVFAFRNGQPVDGFMGAMPETQVRAFVQRLVQAAGGGPIESPVDELMEIARDAFATGDLATAAQAYGQVLQAEPGKPQALAGLARCYIASGDIDRAKQTLALVPPEARNDPDVSSVQASLGLAEKAGDPARIAPLREELARDPKNHQARLDLAMSLIGAGDVQGAIDELLESIRRDRNWNEAAARKELLTIFDALGAGDELVTAGRRKLSTILFS